MNVAATPNSRFFAVARAESRPSRRRCDNGSRIRFSNAMPGFDKGEELHVTLSIAFYFGWASSHLLIPNIADKKDMIRRRAVKV
jgi:hypothetical protein